MHDLAHRGYREVRLDVLLAVPHERGDPVARPDTELAQRVGQPGRVDADLRVGVVPVAARYRGDDRGAPVHRGTVLEQPPDGERDVLHRAEHGAASYFWYSRAKSSAARSCTCASPPSTVASGLRIRVWRDGIEPVLL